MIRRQLRADRPVAIFFFHIRGSANKLLRCIVVDEKRSIASNIRGGPVDDPVIGKFGHLRNFNAIDDAVANSDLRILERFAKRQAQRAKVEVNVSLRTDVKVACQGPVACSDQQRGLRSVMRADGACNTITVMPGTEPGHDEEGLEVDQLAPNDHLLALRRPAFLV
jgi:hypothetical protein